MSDPRARQWMAEGTELFLQTLAALSDDELVEASPLPGWTRRHVTAHVHANALAIGRLVHWAATGDETPMYPPGDARDAEIERLTAESPAELRRLVADSAGTLAAAMDDLPDAAWTATVRSRQGQDIPAADIPWMRAREVYIHAVDLGGSTTFADFPADVTTALVVDVAGRRAASGDGPGLAAWLTGRAAAPTLGAWL